MRITIIRVPFLAGKAARVQPPVLVELRVDFGAARLGALLCAGPVFHADRPGSQVQTLGASGPGGQAFQADQMHKVRRARALNPGLNIEVDGGINPTTARISIENGANVLVAGTSIFQSKDYAKSIRDLRGE